MVLEYRHLASDLTSPAGHANLHTPPTPPAKLIIDTDPGIGKPCFFTSRFLTLTLHPASIADDAMAILMAFRAPELQIIGLTTVFGNVHTNKATENALHLCEVAGFPNVPVAEGPPEPLKGGIPRIADFAHGSDGLGNTWPGQPKNKRIEKNAADFLVEKIQEFPGEVTILALGPLTNIALAIQKDSSFVKKLHKLYVLGGAFFASGNVNPAAEANIYGDPEAADIVFTSGADTTVIGINLTTQIILTESDLCEIRDSKGKHAKYIHEMCRFYKEWHSESAAFEGIYLHDPTCLTALLRPSLFGYKRGAVRVETRGICAGHTLMDMGLKIWNSTNSWTGQPQINVGWTVDVKGVTTFIKEQLMTS